MADLPELNEWTVGVYQLETSDPVLGGPEGIDNLQAKQLANRTRWLKGKLDALYDGTSAAGKATKLAASRTISISGAATGSVNFDGGSSVDISLTLAALSWSKITTGKPTTLGGYGITDAYTKAVTYTKTEVEALLNNMSSLPVGSMVPFPKGTVPTGFLEVDGSLQSIAAFPDLAAYLGTTYNTGGEGAGNFRLPETRGEFLRGWAHGRDIDAGRAIGSYQLDDFKSHNHTTALFLAKDSGSLTNGSSSPYTAGSTTISTNVTGGTETRPRNLAVMWCIKAWNAPINQGNIDVAALAPLAAQATEANQGTAKVASDAQMLDSANDLVMLTPKKARKGFAISLAENGYIAFPTWLGGLILQWGAIPVVAADTIVPMSFTLAFPGSCLGGVVVGNRATAVSGGTSSWYFASPTKTGATLVHDGSNGGSMGAYWFSWGN